MGTSRILYINISWMKRYQGAVPGEDVPTGGFGYTKARPLNDNTQFNFLPFDGKFYGHVPGSTNPNLMKLGGERGTDHVDGVLVVWVAKNPDTNKRVIVGWYDDARVWGDRRKPISLEHEKNRRMREGDVCNYSVEAVTSTSRLLQPGERPELITRGPGQNPFWYGNLKEDHRTLKFIDDDGKGLIKPRLSTGRKFHRSRMQDTDERMRIEKQSMAFVMKMYEQDGYEVEDVSGEKIGYDVRATSVSGELHLEVKGKKGKDVSIELTPNEYQFAKANRTSFRVCVVLAALGRLPRLVELQFHKGAWFDRENNQFMELEKPSLLIRG